MLNEYELAENAQQRQLLAVARQEIELLRRWYAIATDALGRTRDDDARDKGLAIYDRFFAPDARISVRGGSRELSGEGPRAWADVATNALADYQATQHLIGTQVVTFTALAFNPESDSIVSGTAEMASYVQAWHAWPNRRLRLVIGNYQDHVRLQTAVGWQIERMVLAYDSGETRLLGDPP